MIFQHPCDPLQPQRFAEDHSVKADGLFLMPGESRGLSLKTFSLKNLYKGK